MTFARIRAYVFLFAAVAAAAVSGVGHAQPAATWQTRASLAAGRNGAPAAAIDGKIYVVSGCCETSSLTRLADLEVYDPATDSWSTRTPISLPLYVAASSVIDGKWYIAGGQPFRSNTNALQVYDPLLDQWFYGAPMPQATAAAAGAAIDGELYVAGGMNPDNTLAVATLRVYNPMLNTWRTAASMPQAREHAAAAVIAGKLYVVGGGNQSVAHNDLQIYDPSSDSWTLGPAMPTPRYGLGAAAIDGQLYAAGGYDNQTNLRTVERFDPATGIWTRVDDLPEEHGWPAAAALDGILYVIGGRNNTTATSSSNHAYVPVPKQTPTITVNGGSYVYNQQPHPVWVTVTGADGYFVSGQTSVVYSPGGTAPPVAVGTYSATVAFTSSDPGYTDATAFVPGAVTVTPSQAFIFGPPSVTAEATSPAGATPNFFVNASDFDGPLTPLCSPAGPGATFPLGTTQVTCTAQGANSLPASTSFPVTVTDTQRPIIGNASNLTVPATSSQGAIVAFALPPVTDIADAHPAVTTSPASGSLFPHGNTTVTVTARDGSGNVATKTFSVTVTPSLLSITVNPASATIAPGGSRQFSATGIFTDGSTKQLPSGSGGSGGGTSGPGNLAWQARFLPTFPVGACTSTVNGGLSSQAFPAVNGVVDTMWGLGNILHVTGTVNATTVNLAIACATNVSPAPPVLNLTATWTGTRYEGSFTGYSGETIGVRITGWSSKAAMPTARFALGAATLNVNGHDVVYAVGGRSGGSLLPTVESYDPAANVWSPAPAMPTAREGTGVAALGNKLYVVGGNGAGGTPTGAVEVFDPVANAWTSPLPPLPTPRAHFSLVVAGSSLFAIGGDSNGVVTNAVERIDVTAPAPAWTAAAPMPTARRLTAAGALNNGTLIVVAGGQQTNGPALNITERYDVTTNQWTQGPSILAPTAGAASAVVSNALFVFGGANSGPLVLSEMYRPASNLSPDGWAGLTGMPTLRVEAAAAAVGDVIYVAGGRNDALPGGLATLEAFSILEPDQFTLSQGGGSGSNTPPVVTWRVSPASGVATVSSGGNVSGNAPGQVAVLAESGTISCLATNTCGQVIVRDLVPPVIVSLTPSLASLGPPNHKMIPIAIDARAYDSVDPSPVCGVTGVWSNESANALGDGNTAVDWQFTPWSLALELRAERSGTGDGRIYTVQVSCRDVSGNVSRATTTIGVPR